jgi:prepilin signal peptidase PulO-like enzyme (type II secretory pathway)
MAKITIVFGVLLVALGIVGFLPHRAGTALIPAVVGVILLVAGAVAQARPNLRMHVMHVAVLVALLGCLAAIGRIVMSISKGTFGENKLAAASLGGMALLTFVFVLLCVKSFIDARRARKAGLTTS